MNRCLRVSVVLALRDSAFTVELQMDAGSTVEDAVAQSGLAERYPEVALGNLARGIWGKLVRPDTALAEGDRVELYRPLVADPKTERRRRARMPRPMPRS